MLTLIAHVLPLLTLTVQQYTVRTLAPLAQTADAARFEPGSRATVLADGGLAAGSSVTDTPTRNVHACKWMAVGPPVDLGVLGTDIHSMVLGGNAAGDLVGVSFVLGKRVTHGVLWNANGTTIALGDMEPVDINSGLVIVGAKNATGNIPACTRAVRWFAGTTTILPPLAGGPSARAAAVNDAGWTVGCSVLSDRSTTHACLWTGTGAPIDLGTLGGTSSFARDIEGTTVVGVADLPDGTPHACRWNLSASGTVLSIVDLGATPGAPGSSAEVIAADGRIGGNSGDAAVLFGAGGTVDLNTRIPAASGWQLTHVTAMGNGGRIVGRGRLNGIPRGFVLEPAPLSADFNHDGVVDGADLGVLLGAWGPCKNCPADLDGNGIVDGADLGSLLGAWT